MAGWIGILILGGLVRMWEKLGFTGWRLRHGTGRITGGLSRGQSQRLLLFALGPLQQLAWKGCRVTDGSCIQDQAGSDYLLGDPL